MGEGVGVAWREAAGLRADERWRGLGSGGEGASPLPATRHQQAREGQGCRHLEDRTTNFT